MLPHSIGHDYGVRSAVAAVSRWLLWRNAGLGFSDAERWLLRICRILVALALLLGLISAAAWRCEVGDLGIATMILAALALPWLGPVPIWREVGVKRAGQALTVATTWRTVQLDLNRIQRVQAVALLPMGRSGGTGVRLSGPGVPSVWLYWGARDAFDNNVSESVVRELTRRPGVRATPSTLFFLGELPMRALLRTAGAMAQATVSNFVVSITWTLALLSLALLSIFGC